MSITKERRIHFIIYTLLIVILLGCTTNKPPIGMTESKFKLIIATYKKAWIDGANASTKCTNDGTEFNETIAHQLIKKDSLAFVGIL